MRAAGIEELARIVEESDEETKRTRQTEGSGKATDKEIKERHLGEDDDDRARYGHARSHQATRTAIRIYAGAMLTVWADRTGRRHPNRADLGRWQVMVDL